MLGYLLLAPAILLLLVLVGYPFLTAVVMSLQKKLIGQAAAPFIGLDNYISLLTDKTFWVVVRNVLSSPVHRSPSNWSSAPRWRWRSTSRCRRAGSSARS